MRLVMLKHNLTLRRGPLCLLQDIVGLIVGPPGSFVRLDVAALPEGARSSPSPTK